MKPASFRLGLDAAVIGGTVVRAGEIGTVATVLRTKPVCAAIPSPEVERAAP